VIPAGYCLLAVRLLAFCSSKPSAQRLSPCAAATGACALRRPDQAPSRPAQEQKPSNGKPKGKHKIDSNQKPGGLRRKGPPFPSNSSTKLKDPWRISNPREEEGRGTEEQKQKQNSRGRRGLLSPGKKGERESGEGERYLSPTNSKLKD